MENNQKDEKSINEVCDSIMNNLNYQFQIYQNSISQSINQKLSELDNVINQQIDIYTNNIINELIIDAVNIDKIKSPNLINLKIFDNTNFLIDLILLYFSNIDRLSRYYLKPKHEELILRKSKQDPTGIYLSPSYLKLINNLWKGTKTTYDPSEIHEKLKILMQNDYNSTNPGIIINFIVYQLHKELNFNNNMIQPEWNYNMQNAFQSFGNYFKANYNEILDEFFSSIRIQKTTSQNIPMFLYQFTVVFNLYLNNINETVLSLEHHFKNLYININDRIKYCMNNEIFNGKTIYSIPKIFILNINRNKNKKQFFNYPLELYNNNIIENNGQQQAKYELYCVIISKYINNKNIFYAYIRNIINHKWYLYSKDGINLVNNENEVIDGQNASLLIYQKPEKKKNNI